MATDIREAVSSKFDLIDPRVLSRLSELKDLAHSLFECEPIVTAETDLDFPDQHYLLFRVAVTGTIPETSEKDREWHEKKLALLGNLANHVCLFVTFA